MAGFADITDEASAMEQRDIEQALAHQLAKASVVQGVIIEDADGHRYCMDCEEEIDPRRVAAQGHLAVRCIDCQSLFERSGRVDRLRAARGGGGWQAASDQPAAAPQIMDELG